MKFDVIVVGAGPGGSAAAALMAKEGKKVLLVDKNKSAGGRMITIHDKEGFHYELFPINGCPGEGSQMDNVLKRIGKENAVQRIIPKQLGLSDILILRDKAGTLRASNMEKMDLGMLRALRISPFNLPGIIRIIKFSSAY
jgi:prolycopene isomerase